MDMSTVAVIAEVIIAGGILTALLLHWREWPKAKATTAKLEAETEDVEWARFQKEIGRLEERLSRVERENEELRERLDRQRGRERSLEHENDQLRAQVQELENRLAALEALFKTHPLTPEMQKALDALK